MRRSFPLAVAAAICELGAVAAIDAFREPSPQRLVRPRTAGFRLVRASDWTAPVVLPLETQDLAWR